MRNIEINGSAGTKWMNVKKSVNIFVSLFTILHMILWERGGYYLKSA